MREFPNGQSSLKDFPVTYSKLPLEKCYHLSAYLIILPFHTLLSYASTLKCGLKPLLVHLSFREFPTDTQIFCTFNPIPVSRLGVPRLAQIVTIVLKVKLLWAIRNKSFMKIMNNSISNTVPTSVSYYEVGTVLSILHVLFNFHNNSKIITNTLFQM